MYTLQYYYAKDNRTELVIFNKYTIDTNGVIRNKKTRRISSTQNDTSGYKTVTVRDDADTRHRIRVNRAVASTYHGPPPTPDHTADHVDRNRTNDMLCNIRWASKKEQADNRKRPEALKSAFIVTKDGLEMSIQEWVEYLKDQKNHLKHGYTVNMIKQYAPNKQHGFAYKEYQDLPDEVWKEVTGSVTNQGRWEISNMNRVKYITNHAENVLSGERLGLINGYPTISLGACHILAFMTFFPEEWANKKPNEIILHEDDDKMDFRPHKLRIGTRSENGKDAHNNGCYDGTIVVRMKCYSYINGVLEKEHDSLHDAVRYLRIKGVEKASQGNISPALNGKRKDGRPKIAYGRTWKLSD